MRGNDLTIATLGGHSALEICLGAKECGLKTIVIAKKGREKTYSNYYRTLVDRLLLVDSFADITEKKVISSLLKQNAVFIPHRYCQVYTDLGKLEKAFPVPVFGNKLLLKYEEREKDFNQYQLLKKADLDYPLQYDNPEYIDRLVIVKVNEKSRGYERAFFFADSFTDYKKKSNKMISTGKITEEGLKKAVIEEYLVGAQINFNFFYSVLKNRLELLGTDARRQTNIDGLVRLPAGEQLKMINYIKPSYIETGHFAVTVKESLLEKAFDLGEKLVQALKEAVPPGLIGPFALQTVVIPGPPKEKIVIYDLSLRIPGSPGTIFTPYSRYLFFKDVSFGERIAQEIKDAVNSGRINKITT